MRFEIVEMTPEMAGELLKRNDGNRRLREMHAAKLARAMNDGKFKLTHQPIAVTKRGRLIDGQHRLRAIILANQAIKIVVAYDVPEDTYAVLDAGLIRRMHERLRSNPKHTQLCTSLHRIMLRSTGAQEYEMETLLEIFEKALQAYDAVPRKGNMRGFTVMHLAAVVLRFAVLLKAGDVDGVSRLQWLLEKIYRHDLTGAPPIIHSFYRQMSEGVKSYDMVVSPDTDRFCRAWVAFDPQSESVQKLQVNDHAGIVKEARQEFRAITQGVFDP